MKGKDGVIQRWSKSTLRRTHLRGIRKARGGDRRFPPGVVEGSERSRESGWLEASWRYAVSLWLEASRSREVTPSRSGVGRADPW